MRKSLVIKSKLATLKGDQMLLVCSSVGNPDRGQYAPLSEVECFAVDSFEQASGAARAYIRMWDLGGGNWSGGQIFSGAGHNIADVSYNGRVWKAGKDFVNRSEIEIDGAVADKFNAHYTALYDVMLTEYASSQGITF